MDTFTWTSKLEAPTHRLPQYFGFELADGEREKKAVRAYLWWPEGVDQDHNQPSAISSVRFRDREASEIFIVPILASEWLSLFLTLEPRITAINNALRSGDRYSLESARDQVNYLATDVQDLHRKCMARYDPQPTKEDGGRAADATRRVGWVEKNFLYRFAIQELRQTSEVIKTHLKYLTEEAANQWDPLGPVRRLFHPSEPHHDLRGHCLDEHS